MKEFKKAASIVTLFIIIGITVYSCQNEPVDFTPVTDTDGDGIPDGLDNCLETANPNQVDLDGNGVGDICDTDGDSDGVIDALDNCPFFANPDQADANNDGIGDACENDGDNDGIPDNIDNCVSIANSNQLDTDSDGIGDVCDLDNDNDGINDDIDNCPLIANPDQADANSDGIGDACENNTQQPLYLCENGMAGPYSCNDYDLMSHISAQDLGGIEGLDSWGWTDPTTNIEYALICTNTGAAFVDIQDPTNPIVLGTLATATSNNGWRDIKVYNDHAFIVSEANGHGMQVFDLTRLRNVTNPPEAFTTDAHYTGFGSAHNIVINEESGYAYAVGTSTFGGGPHFVNIQNPTNPVASGGYATDGYTHDAEVVTYNGPDTDHTGKEIYIGSNANEVVIVDVTDKVNPVNISTVIYPNIGYTHQGSFTNDLKYFILGDEYDEQNTGNNTRSIIFDFTDLDNPTIHMEYFGPTRAIDHNVYVVGNLAYQANYSAGVRMIDISNIGTGAMNEVGSFDTYPNNDNASFHGAWNVYPFFASGNIIISDIEGGLFIVKKSN